MDGANLYQFVRDDPKDLVDPKGLGSETTQPTSYPAGHATFDLKVGTGGTKEFEPWIGAKWTTYRFVNHDSGDSGLVRIGLPNVKSKTDNCKVTFKISITLQIELRDVPTTQPVIKVSGASGERVLTPVGAGVAKGFKRLARRSNAGRQRAGQYPRRNRPTGFKKRYPSARRAKSVCNLKIEWRSTVQFSK